MVEGPLRNVRSIDLKERLLEGKTIILTGGSGLVGSFLVNYFHDLGANVISPTSSELDVTNKEQVEKYISQTEVDFVIHAAAWTDVEGAQKDPVVAKKVNVDGVRNVAEIAKKHGKHLVCLSTDFVFEGTEENPGPYSEDAPTASINSEKIGEYAKSKVGTEQELKEVGGEVALVRISYPFGNFVSQKDFVNRTLSYIEKGYALFNDQIFTPTYLPDLARAVAVIVNRRLTGIFHVATIHPTTPYEFGRFICEQTSRDSKSLKAGSLAEFLKPSEDPSKPRRTPKPIMGGLDVQETEKRLGLKFTSWKDAVAAELVELNLVK